MTGGDQWLWEFLPAVPCVGGALGALSVPAGRGGRWEQAAAESRPAGQGGRHFNFKEGED